MDRLIAELLIVVGGATAVQVERCRNEVEAQLSKRLANRIDAVPVTRTLRCNLHRRWTAVLCVADEPQDDAEACRCKEASVFCVGDLPDL